MILGIGVNTLKVEFYGQTRVNYAEGNFESQGGWSANLTIDTSTYKFGTSSGKIDNSAGTGNKASDNLQRKLHLNGKYVLMGFWAKANSGTPLVRLYLTERDASGNAVGTVDYIETNVSNTWKFYYKKVDLTTLSAEYFTNSFQIRTYGTADDVVNFDGLFVQELTSTQYNEIGVSWTDEMVEMEFPYVDSEYVPS